MTKLALIIVVILFSMISGYTTRELSSTFRCKGNNLNCISSTECCSGICHEKCIARCQPVNAACNKLTELCCSGLQCEQSTQQCCRLVGQTTLTPSECCSQHWIPNSNGCGGKCILPCQPVNATCDNQTNVCCNGLQCPQWNKKCCRLVGQTSLTPSECCSQSWIPNSVGGGGGKCCSQHAGPCTAASDCCSAADNCSNPQWPNICV